MTKEQFNKKTGRQYKHYVQSFNPNDKVSIKQAHEIGLKFMQNEKFKGYEVIMATHNDKKHVHNHFIVNSVSFENGMKYHEKKSDLQELKEFNIELCHEYDFTVPVKGKNITTDNMNKYQVIKHDFENPNNAKSYILKTATDIKNTMKESNDRDDFIKNMEQQGYKVNWTDTRKNVTFENLDGKKVRLSNLEKTFKKEIFTKGGLENEFRRVRELAGGERSPYNLTNREVDGILKRVVEENKRVERTDAKLHPSADERRHDKENDTRKRIGSDSKDKRRNSKTDEIDVEKARRKSIELRKTTTSDFGRWKNRNKNKQSENIDRTERDKQLTIRRDEHSKDIKPNEHGKNIGDDRKKPKRIKPKDRGFDR